ncbi:MAG: YfiR family protein [Methylotenera sp.]|nr:YfiR family protein [Methylotenera sp.]
MFITFLYLQLRPQLNDTINFCVIGEVAQLSALKQYEGRNVSNASVRVKKVETIEEARACEVLFIQTNNQARANELYQALAGFPVLTVAEYRAFAQPAAIILFVQTNNRLAFEVNHTVAVEAQLSLSYKLLRLARKVNMTAP